MAFEDQIVKYTQTVAELDAVDTTTLPDGQQASVENDGIYVLDKIADEWTQTTLKAPYILPAYRGLKISEFLNSDEPDVDQTAQIGEAIGELSSNNNKYTSLDFEGKLIGVDGSLDMASYLPANGIQAHKIIKNGSLVALKKDTGLAAEFTTAITTELGSRTVEFSPGVAIVPGMFVSGPGVARETYIVSVDTVSY